MGLFDKQKYLMKVRYNGVITFTNSLTLAPMASWFRKKYHSAYLIPPDIAPIRDGNNHIIDYNQNDAVPLADLIDIIPDQIIQIEPLIAKKVIKGIDNLYEDEKDGIINLSPEFKEQLERVREWMLRYQGTTLIYQLWRWGYLKGETWYKSFRNLDREEVENVVFPTKLTRVGLNPVYLFEREKSTMVPDIIKRPEPKWAWLEPYIYPILAVILIIVALYYGARFL
jgi:hypothetical protein